MDGAEIAVRTRLGERVRVLVVGVERLRLEFLLVAHHRVRNVVAVGPAHGRAGWNGDGGRREAEVVDLHLDRCGLGVLRGRGGTLSEAGGWQEKEDRYRENAHFVFHILLHSRKYR